MNAKHISRRSRLGAHIPILAYALFMAMGLAAKSVAAPPTPAPAPGESAAPHAATPADPIDAMLGVFDLTRDTLTPDPTALLLRSRGQLASPLTTRLLLRPLEVPYVAGHLAAQFRRWSFSIVRTTLNVVGYTPAEISRGYIGNPLREWDERLAQAGDPLLAAAETLWSAAADRDTSGATTREMPSAARDEWVAASKSLPPSWRREIARLLMASASAAEWQRKAFQPLDDPDRDSLAKPRFPGFSEESDLRPAIRDTDYDYLFAGAMDVAVAAEDFEHFLDSKPEPFEGNHTLETPLGRVVLRGGAADTNDDPSPALVHTLLVVDLGGDDLYRNGTTRGGIDYPVQMIFDAAGNDRYIAEDPYTPSWGGAVAGYALLLDRGGNDEYRGLLATQGAAILGAGILIDRAGDDTYLGYGFAQGTGYAGIGIVQDDAGDDRYEALTRAQGCGDSLGAGLLFDRAGNDRYLLDDEKIRVPSPQSREHNSSMGQGTGVGHRADLTDGHSVPGGVGILYDVSGDDQYSAGVFAQGCGFLGGAGLLMDDTGSDTLKAAYYAQGAAAHRGVGAVIDRGGNDTYETSMQCAQGSGHDLAVAWLLDLAGDDRYTAFRLAQGAANENGWGFCVDLAGDDRYTVAAPPDAADSAGAAKLNKWGTTREDTPAFGLFLDAGGRDTYAGVKSARDNARWIDPPQRAGESFKSERGIGCDGEFPAVELRTGPLTPFPQSEFDEYAAQQKLRRRYRDAK